VIEKSRGGENVKERSPRGECSLGGEIFVANPHALKKVYS